MKDSTSTRNRDLFVEGVVIVLSILLAFGIDALWDQHKQRLEEEEILASLANLCSGDRIQQDWTMQFRC